MVMVIFSISNFSITTSFSKCILGIKRYLICLKCGIDKAKSICKGRVSKFYLCQLGSNVMDTESGKMHIFLIFN